MAAFRCEQFLDAGEQKDTGSGQPWWKNGQTWILAAVLCCGGGGMNENQVVELSVAAAASAERDLVLGSSAGVGFAAGGRVQNLGQEITWLAQP